jgi:hypothetical protein
MRRTAWRYGQGSDRVRTVHFRYGQGPYCTSVRPNLSDTVRTTFGHHRSAWWSPPCGLRSAMPPRTCPTDTLATVPAPARGAGPLETQAGRFEAFLASRGSFGRTGDAKPAARELSR